MTLVVRALFFTQTQLNELVPKIDKRIVITLSAELEIEDRAVEVERSVQVVNFEHDVIDSEGARFPDSLFHQSREKLIFNNDFASDDAVSGSRRHQSDFLVHNVKAGHRNLLRQPLLKIVVNLHLRSALPFPPR